MKRFRIRFTPEASKLISNLHPETKKMIRAALDGLIGFAPTIHDLSPPTEVAL